MLLLSKNFVHAYAHNNNKSVKLKYFAFIILIIIRGADGVTYNILFNFQNHKHKMNYYC